MLKRHRHKANQRAAAIGLLERLETTHTRCGEFRDTRNRVGHEAKFVFARSLASIEETPDNDF